MSQAEKRILGIDPGSVVTGYGVIDSDGKTHKLITGGTIKTGGGDFPERLAKIFAGLGQVLDEFGADEMAIESVFVSHNAGSALKLGQARGAAICAAVSRGIAVSEYAPREVKQALVGKGSADKAQVAHMAGILLNTKQKFSEDASDALAIALTHCHTSGTRKRWSESVVSSLGADSKVGA